MRRQKHTEPYIIAKIALLQQRGELALPDVQRDLVWTHSQKQLLIDSLLKDFDIPKLYFREIEDEKVRFEVVDGQQRINAIIDFIDNKYELPKDSDPFGGEETAGKHFDDFSTDLQIEFKNRALDVVILQGYSDEEMEETFLRLQNGTPLKAPEKRRAIQGNMRNVVAKIAKHQVFDSYCGFENKHFAYEDVAAKVIRQMLSGGPTSISAQSLARMYEQYRDIDENDKIVKDILRALNYLDKAFKNGPDPKLKKYAIADLTLIASGMLKTYDAQNYADQFGAVYLQFLNERALNAEKPEDEQDNRLNAYSNSARGDSLEFLEFRQKLLREYFIDKMPYLVAKDPNRRFTADQRDVIYRLGGGVCANCGKSVTEDEFEADHIKPWSKGGLTQISNGQLLCIDCNRSKKDNDQS